ncbi:DNA topoisomerase III [Lactiplantibacillus plantarum]|nr:DNA topoisomerase III [Lactiplantibacillus plantarum]
MTFMQAKHVQKGSQAGLIKGVQNQAKKRASPNYSHYPVSRVP